MSNQIEEETSVGASPVATDSLYDVYAMVPVAGETIYQNISSKGKQGETKEWKHTNPYTKWC